MNWYSLLFIIYVSPTVLKNIIKDCKKNSYTYIYNRNLSYIRCSVEVFTYIKKFFRQHKGMYKIEVCAYPPLFEDDVKELNEILSKQFRL